MLRTPLLYINDILEAIGKIENYTARMEFSDFENDERTLDAVIRNFEVIGEVSRQLPQEVKNRHPEIPWRMVTDFRQELSGIPLRTIFLN
jgi:uncharacterized protein with HEPN domain